MPSFKLLRLIGNIKSDTKMERVKPTLITFLCVVFCGVQRTYGTEVKIKVKPGDNVTVLGDCVIPVGSHIFWIRNNSYGNTSISLFAEDLFQRKFPRLHFVANTSSNSFDLHIKNVSVKDEGIYYCAKVERKIKDVNDKTNVKLEYQYGDRRTHLSLLEAIPSESTLPEVSELNCSCWMLLLSVCSVCVLSSSLISAACVYCLCRTQTTELFAEIHKENVSEVYPTETHQCEMSKTGNVCLHSEVIYRLLPSDHPYTKM